MQTTLCSRSVSGKGCKQPPRENSPCWEWTGTRGHEGYGTFTRDHVTKAAHRASWEAFCGPIPEGLFVLHRCDNPPCVNPAHLFLGTKQDNRIDAIAKFRVPLGERHPRARLTVVKVLEARELFANGETLAALARRYGVDRDTIEKAVKGQTWSHVNG